MSGTGDQVITGLSHTPKAIIFMSTLQTPGAGPTKIDDGVYFGCGFSDGTNHRSVSIGSTDALTSSDTGKRTTDTIHYIGDTAATRTIFLEFTVKDVVEGGFTIAITTNSIAGAIIPFYSIGDDGITNVSIGTGTLATSGANQDFTGPGFTPDFTMIIGGMMTVHPTHSNGANLSIGFCKSATEQASLCVCSVDTSGAMSTRRIQRNNAGYVQIVHNSTTLDAVATYSTLSTGFRLSFSDLPAAADKILYMCIKGIKCAIGDFAVTAGTGTQAVTAPAGNDFTPDGLILASDQSATENPAATETHNHLSMGFADTENLSGHACAIGDETATPSSISETARIISTESTLNFLAIDIAATASATVKDLVFDTESMDSGGGFSIVKTTNTDAQLGRIIFVTMASILALAEKQPVALGRPLAGQIAAFHSSRQRPIFG